MLRYGGNTTCVEVRAGGSCIILDAGTGLRSLSEALGREPHPPRVISLLITHTHWDHIIGFPFFEPISQPKNRIEVYGLQRTQSSLRTTIANALSDPLTPTTLEDLRAEMIFHEIHEDMDFQIENKVRVCTAQANHPYRALAYRIEADGAALVFIPDTGPFHTVLFGDERIEWTGQPTPNTAAELDALADMRAKIVDLARGADWLIYDSQFTEAQYARFPHWGHSTPAQAREIAEEAGVGQLLLFHHDPHHTDAQIDAMLEEQQSTSTPGLSIVAAYEGLVLSKGERS